MSRFDDDPWSDPIGPTPDRPARRGPSPKLIGGVAAAAALVVAVVIAVVIIGGGKTSPNGKPIAGASSNGSAVKTAAGGGTGAGTTATSGTATTGGTTSTGRTAATGGTAATGSSTSASACSKVDPTFAGSTANVGAGTKVFDQLINYQDWAGGPASDPSKIFASNVVQCGLNSPRCGIVSGVSNVAAAYTSWQNDDSSAFDFEINADPTEIPISGDTAEVQTTFNLTDAKNAKAYPIEFVLVDTGGQWLISNISAACAS